MIGLLLEMDVKLSQSKNAGIKEMLANNLLVVYTSVVRDEANFYSDITVKTGTA
jgi:predicted nucleotidyltransferase